MTWLKMTPQIGHRMTGTLCDIWLYSICTADSASCDTHFEKKENKKVTWHFETRPLKFEHFFRSLLGQNMFSFWKGLKEKKKILNLCLHYNFPPLSFFKLWQKFCTKFLFFCDQVWQWQSFDQETPRLWITRDFFYNFFYPFLWRSRIAFMQTSSVLALINMAICSRSSLKPQSFSASEAPWGQHCVCFYCCVA